MLLVNQGSAPSFNLPCSGVPASYLYSAAGAGSGSNGGGSLSAWTRAAQNYASITLAAGDTGTLGDLLITALDGSGNVVGTVNLQVVAYDPDTGADPWATALPGAYTSGQAGHIVGNGVPDVAAGAAGGLLINGTNVGNVVLGSFTSGTFVVSGNAGIGGSFTVAQGVEFASVGTTPAFWCQAGGTGPAVKLVGGATSGAGIVITTTSGDGIDITPTAGHGVSIAANGTSKHGLVSTGGTAGTSDGVRAVAGTGGVDLRANLTGNVTGNLSGSVGSLSGVTFPSNFSVLAIDSNGRIKILSGVTKNVALSNFAFVMYSSSDHVTPATGLTIASQRSIDGGGFANCSNSATEVGNGDYVINLGASDLNGGVIVLKFTASGADATYVTVIPTP